MTQTHQTQQQLETSPCTYVCIHIHACPCTHTHTMTRGQCVCVLPSHSLPYSFEKGSLAEFRACALFVAFVIWVGFFVGFVSCLGWWPVSHTNPPVSGLQAHRGLDQLFPWVLRSEHGSSQWHHTHSHTHTHTHSQAITHSQSHTHRQSHTLTYTLRHSHVLTHTLTDTHTYTHSFTEPSLPVT